MSDGSPPSHDPLTAILVMLAEIKTKVETALGRIEKHDDRLDDHGRRLDEHGQRLSALEAAGQRDDVNESRSYSRGNLWATSIGTAAAVIAIFLTVLYATKGG